MRSPYRTGSYEYRIFEDALNIQSPWEIKEVRLDYLISRFFIVYIDENISKIYLTENIM